MIDMAEINFRKIIVYERQDDKVGNEFFSLTIPLNWYKEVLQTHLSQLDVPYLDEDVEELRPMLTTSTDAAQIMKQSLLTFLPKIRKQNRDYKQAWMNLCLLAHLASENLVWIHSIDED